METPATYSFTIIGHEERQRLVHMYERYNCKLSKELNDAKAAM